MATEVERLVVTLDAKLDAYMRNMMRAQQSTNQQFTSMEARFAQFQKKAEGAAGSVGAVLATIGTYLSVTALQNYANEWNRVSRSIDGSQQVFGIALKNAAELNVLASDARVPLEAYAKLYIRTSAAIRDYNFSAGTAEQVTSTLAKALKLGGADAGEQASVLLQFSQALQKGKLDGDEFRTVMENAGVVQELLAKRLNTTKGGIVEMAAAGKLQIRDLVGAMTDGAQEVDRIYRQMPVTIDEAFQVLNNSITQYIGDMDKAYGISEGYAGALAFLARNIETVGDAALVAGAALLAAFSPAVLARIWAFAAGSAAALGPLGLIAVAAAAAGMAYATFGDDIRPIPGQIANLHDVVSAFADVTSDRLAPALTVAGETASHLGSILRGVADDAGKALTGTENAINFFVAANKAMFKNSALGRYVAEGLKGADQNAIGNGFETTVSRPSKAGAAGASSAGGDAKLSAYQKEVNAIVKKTNALQEQAKVVGASAYETERASVARDLLTAAEETARRTGTAVTAQQVADIQQMADKYGQVASQVEYLRMMQGAKENLEQLQRENSLIGLQGVALEAATIKQQLLNEAKKTGAAYNEAEIDSLAQRTAAEKQFQTIVADSREIMRDGLKGVITDIREGKSALEAFGGVLDKLGSKMLDMAANNLIESALGGMFSGGTAGSGGGWAASLTRGFSSGGYTGNGGRNQPAGVVHKGEFVVNASQTAKNRPLLEALNAGGSGLRAAAAPAPAATRGAANITVAATFNVENGTPEGVEKLKTEIVPLIKGVVADAMARNSKFGRT